MGKNNGKIIHSLELATGILSLIAGIALIVFSMIDIPNSMLWQVCLGLAILCLALVYMILYARSRKS